MMTLQSPNPLPPLLLRGLTEADTNAVLARASSHDVPARTVLCRQGERARSMFIVRRGCVRFARTTLEGREVLLRRLGPGECFGIASLVPGPVNYMATAVTLDEARIYLWDAAAIRSAALTFPRLGQNALCIALQYLEEYGERHTALLSKTAAQRLGRALTHLGATSGRVLPTGVEVEVSNYDLASLADVGPFTVSRQLNQWERQGHVVKRRKRVLIRHPEALLGD